MKLEVTFLPLKIVGKHCVEHFQLSKVNICYPESYTHAKTRMNS